MTELSVLIVTYNSGAEIDACLEAVLAQEVDAEVIVVDNASDDDTVERVAAYGDKVRLIESPVNDGYAPGVNRAFAASTGRFVALVNPDCAPDPGCLEKLIAHLEDTPGAGVAAAALRNEDGTPQLFARRELDLAGTLLTMTDLGQEVDQKLLGGRAMRRRRYEDEFEGGVDEVMTVDCPAAACIVLWRALCEPRPMDPGLPLMFNDGDLYRRLRQKGYRCDIVPAAGARHLYGASIRRVPRSRMRAEYVAALRRYSAPWSPLARWGLWIGLAGDGAVGLLRTMARSGGASSAARGRSRGTLGGLGLPGGVAPWLTPKPNPKTGLRAAVRRGRQAPRRALRASTLRLRRRWFALRLRLAAAWVGSRVTVELHPTADIGWRQQLELRPRSHVVVRVGERSTIRDDVILRLAGTLDIGSYCDVRWGCILNVKGTLRLEGRTAFGRGSSCHVDGTMVWGWGSMCGEYVSVVDTNHDVDGSLLHPLDQPVPQADITIGPTAFLGAHAVVTAGCTIGQGTVVGANSVVTRSLPPRVLAAGVPAKVLKDLPGR